MSDTSLVRVRFAPSPTGYLHVGGLRTALYNYLFTKQKGGTFILRLEDTDQKRFVPGSAESLIQTLDALGMQYEEGPFLKHQANGKVSRNYPEITEVGDSGPYIQSERLDLYKKYADELVESGKAYYCFCSAERLAQIREEQTRQKQAPKYDKHCLSLAPDTVAKRLTAGEPYVLRLNISSDRGDVVFSDIVRGQVKIHVRDIDDQVLMKSDGFPTYHLASVVDDHLMRITHVIRSEEWISSTPKHILLYEAFGWDIPEFAHIPLLLNQDKSKLSKRQGDVAVEEYLTKGYLQEALINFVALLGWHPGQGKTQEIFTLEELVSTFNLAQVHKAGAVFDIQKLDWMNAEYIKRLPLEELYERARPFLEVKDFFKRWQEQHSKLSEEEQSTFVKKVLEIEQDRLTKLSDVGENNLFFFAQDIIYDKILLHWKQNTVEMTKDALIKAESTLTGLSDNDWQNKKTLEAVLMKTADDYAQSLGGIEAGRGKGDFLWPLRVALTGAERSPSPFDVAWILGKEEGLKRVQNAILFLT